MSHTHTNTHTHTHTYTHTHTHTHTYTHTYTHTHTHPHTHTITPYLLYFGTKKNKLKGGPKRKHNLALKSRKMANISICRLHLVLLSTITHTKKCFLASNLGHSHGDFFFTVEKKQDGSWHIWYFHHTFQPCSHNHQAQNSSTQSCFKVFCMLFFWQSRWLNQLKNDWVYIYRIPIDKAHDAFSFPFAFNVLH